MNFFIAFFFEGYEEEEEEGTGDEEEVLKEAPAHEDKDEVVNHDDHPRVSLRQDDINQHYDIKEEIGKLVEYFLYQF